MGSVCSIAKPVGAVVIFIRRFWGRWEVNSAFDSIQYVIFEGDNTAAHRVAGQLRSSGIALIKERRGRSLSPFVRSPFTRTAQKRSLNRIVPTQ